MKHQKKFCYKRIILLLNSLLIIFSTILSNSVVYADDYDYLPVGDVEQYNAYRFWQLYGFKLDYTNTISYTSTQSGTFTYTGTVSGSLSGQETASYNISLTGDISTLGQGSATGITYESTGHIYNFDSNANPITLHLVPTDSAYEQNTVMACTFTNPNTNVGAYASMTCQNSGGYEPATYDLDLRTLSTGESGAIQVSLNTSNSGSGGLSGTVSLSSSESINGSGSISLSGTESTTGHKIYDIPSLKVDNLNNNFNSNKRIRNNYVIAYLTSTAISNGLPAISIIDSNNNENTDAVITRIGNYYDHPGYYFQCYEITNIHKQSTIKFNDQVNNVIPIYVGLKDNMSDKLYRYIYGSDRTDELLDGGTDQSKQATNNLADAGDNLSDSSDQLHDFEQDQKNNMNNALNNIDLNFDNPFKPSAPTTGSKPLSTMSWVKRQFDKLVQPAPIRYILIYSLTIGLALTILGKLRNR